MSNSNKTLTYQVGNNIIYTDILKRESDKTSTGQIIGLTRDKMNYVVLDGSKQRMVSPENVIGLQEYHEDKPAKKRWFFESGGSISDYDNEIMELEIENQDFQRAINMDDFPSNEKELAKELLQMNISRIDELNKLKIDASAPTKEDVFIDDITEQQEQEPLKLIPIKSVTIQDSEGFEEYINNFPKTFNDFIDAHNWIKANIEIEEQGYDKHYIKYEWADGKNYEGRLDISVRENNPNKYINLFAVDMISGLIYYIIAAANKYDEDHIEQAKEYVDDLRKYDFQITYSDLIQRIAERSREVSANGWLVRDMHFKTMTPKEVEELVIIKLGNDFIESIKAFEEELKSNPCSLPEKSVVQAEEKLLTKEEYMETIEVLKDSLEFASDEEKESLQEAIDILLEISENMDLYQSEPDKNDDEFAKGGSADVYEVNVGNIGNIKCANLKEARKTYNEYVNQSKNNYGRAAGEDVALMKNGEPIEEYFGTLNEGDEYNEDDDEFAKGGKVGVISFKKIWDKEGFTYNQTVKITKETFEKLKDAVNSEIALKYPRKDEYVSTSGYEFYLEPLKLKGDICFLNHTQTRFINLFLKLPLKDRNTALKVVEKFEEGGELGENSLLAHVKKASSGEIARMCKDKDNLNIDAIRRTAIQILNKNGDMPRSATNFYELIQRAEELTNSIVEPILTFDDFQVKIQYNKKFNRWEGLHRIINPKTKEPLYKFGFEKTSMVSDKRIDLISKYQYKYGNSKTINSADYKALMTEVDKYSKEQYGEGIDKDYFFVIGYRELSRVKFEFILACTLSGKEFTVKPTDLYKPSPRKLYAEGGEIGDKYKIVNGTAYHKNTPQEVISVLESVRNKNTKIKLYYGDVKTGRDWNEEHDTIGTVGRSNGTYKIPLLIPTSRSISGGSIIDDCILKIKDVRTGTILYQHPKYQQSKIDIVPSDMQDKGYSHNLLINNSLYSRHKTLRSAELLKAKLMEKGGDVEDERLRVEGIWFSDIQNVVELDKLKEEAGNYLDKDLSWATSYSDIYNQLDFYDQFENFVISNYTNDNFAKGGSVKKKITDAIPEISKIEEYYNFSIRGNANQIEVSDPDIDRMVEDYRMFLSDKEFMERWGWKLVGGGHTQESWNLLDYYDEDDFDENGLMEELRVTNEYYIEFKDGSTIQINFSLPDYDFLSASINEDEENTLAEQWLPIFDSNEWDMDIDSLVEAVNEKQGVEFAEGGEIKLNAGKKYDGSEVAKIQKELFAEKKYFELLNYITQFYIKGKPVNKIFTHFQQRSANDMGHYLFKWMQGGGDKYYQDLIVERFLYNKDSYYGARHERNPYKYWKHEGISEEEFDDTVLMIKEASAKDIQVTFNEKKFEEGGTVKNYPISDKYTLSVNKKKINDTHPFYVSVIRKSDKSVILGRTFHEKATLDEMKQWASKDIKDFETGKDKLFAKGGSVEHTNKYKFRAECKTDVEEFLKTVPKSKINNIKYYAHDKLPDVEVEIETSLNAVELKKYMEAVSDTHVMRETIRPVKQYTGIRNERNAITNKKTRADLYKK